MTFDIGVFATKLMQLHDQSGLNWRQVGMLFDVSERTVRYWATGYAKPVSTASTRCDELLRRLSLLDERTPEEYRRRLLSSKKGMSLFHQWHKEVKKASPIVNFDSMNLYRDYYND